MNIKSIDTVQIKVEAESGAEYALLLPVGAPIEEALQVTSKFTSIISHEIEIQKKKQEEKTEETECPTEQ